MKHNCFTSGAILSLTLGLLLSPGHVIAQEPTSKILDELFSSTNSVDPAITRKGDTIVFNAQKPTFGDYWRNKVRRVHELYAPFTLAGDFEFFVNFDVQKLGAATGALTQEGNGEISIHDPFRRSQISISVNTKPNQPSTFQVMRTFVDRNGMQWHTHNFPRNSTTGRIGLRRQAGVVVVLAADGPGQQLVELVRFCTVAEWAYRPRFLAFQGNGPNPTVVQMTLSDLSIRADQIQRNSASMTLPVPRTPPARYPLQLDYSKTPGKVLVDFKLSNDQFRAFREVDGGIQVKPPVQPQYKKEVGAYWYHDSKFALDGDFEASFRYRVNNLGPIGTDGYGSLSFGMSLETDSPIGSISFGRGVSRSDGDRYSITQYVPTRKGPTWNTQVFRTRSKSGRMILSRTGSEVTIAMEDDSQPGLQELLRIPFISGPIKRLRLSTDQGGNCTNAIDAVITDFRISAQKLVDPDKGTPLIAAATETTSNSTSPPETVVVDSVPQVKSRKWVFLLAGGGVILVALIAGGIVLFLYGRGASRDDE